MNVNRKIKTLEKETNKILAKLYKNKTYAYISNIEIDRDLELTHITMRLGVYARDGKTVQEQAEIKCALMFDLYTIKQTAALCANEGLEKIEQIDIATF